MIFEELVSRVQHGRTQRRSGGAASGITILPRDSGLRRRGVVGGAVLVASKLLRGLALIAGYRVLSWGMTTVHFAWATLAIASAVLLVTQRPWVGKPLTTVLRVKAIIQSLLLAVGRPPDQPAAKPARVPAYTASSTRWTGLLRLLGWRAAPLRSCDDGDA
jgi:hypothetical protein